MIWGSTWSGMQQRGVTVFHPWPINFTNISVSPDHNVGLGTQLTIVFETYERLLDDPTVTVNGIGSTEFVSKSGYSGGAYVPYYIYTYTVTTNDLNMININGRCEISINGVGLDNKARLGCKWCVTLPD